MNVVNVYQVVCLSVQQVVRFISFPDYSENEIYMCTILSLEQLFKLFLLNFFFLEILLTIYSSNDLAQDVLVLFWSQLLVTHSTLDVQAMVNWWSSQEILFPLTLLFLAQNTSLLTFFFLIRHAHSLCLVFSNPKQMQ